MFFRHCLRMVLLIDELTQLVPPETTASQWRDELDGIANDLERICRTVDPQTTDETLEDRAAAAAAATASAPAPDGT